MAWEQGNVPPAPSQQLTKSLTAFHKIVKESTESNISEKKLYLSRVSMILEGGMKKRGLGF